MIGSRPKDFTDSWEKERRGEFAKHWPLSLLFNNSAYKFSACTEARCWKKEKKKLSFIKRIPIHICISPGLRFGDTVVNNTDEALVLIKLMLVQGLLARGHLAPRSQSSTACRCSEMSLGRARGCTLACSGGQGATKHPMTMHWTGPTPDSLAQLSIVLRPRNRFSGN